MAKIEHRGLVQVDARWLASLLGAALLVPPLTVRGADAADAIAQPDASAGAADSSKKSGSKKSGSKTSGS
ncbi:MAG: hypothetical protein KC468_12045, partial [Myxococcales bacterium]|nr:hypothetical protein [Myxococcales bacterium]